METTITVETPVPRTTTAVLVTNPSDPDEMIATGDFDTEVMTMEVELATVVVLSAATKEVEEVTTVDVFEDVGALDVTVVTGDKAEEETTTMDEASLD